MLDDKSLLIKIKAEKDQSIDAVPKATADSIGKMTEAITAYASKMDSFADRLDSLINRYHVANEVSKKAIEKLTQGTINQKEQAAASLFYAERLATTLSGVVRSGIDLQAGVSDINDRFTDLTHSATRTADIMTNINEIGFANAFNLDSLRKAGGQLTMFNQNVEDTLRKVTDLAARADKPVEATAEIVGRALEGNKRAWLALKTQYNIATADLAFLGAELDKSGNIALKSSTQIERAGRALMEWIRLNAEGAAKPESLREKLTAAHNAFQVLKEDLSKPVGSIAESATSGMIGLSKTLNSLPPQIKYVMGMLATMAGAGGVGLAGLIALKEPLEKMIILFPSLAGGAKTAAGSMAMAARETDLLALALTRAKAASLAFLSTPIGLAIAAATVIYIGASAALNAYGEAQKREGEKLKEESRQLQSNIQAWRQYRDIINNTLKDKGELEYTGDLGDMLSNISTEMNKLTPREIVLEFKSKGYDFEKVKTGLQDVIKERDKFQQQEDKMQKVSSLLDRYDLGQTMNVPASLAMSTQGIEGPMADMEKLGIKIEDIRAIMGKSTFSAEEFRAKLTEISNEYNSNAKSAAVLDQVVQKWQQYDDVLDQIIERQKELSSYFDFAQKIGSISALRDALATINTELNKAKSAKTGVDFTDAGLLAALKNASTDEDRNQLSGIIAMRTKQGEIEKKLAEKLMKERREAFDASFTDRKKTAKDELIFLQSLPALYQKEGIKSEEVYRDIGQKIAEANRKANEERISDSRKAFQRDIQDRMDYITRMRSMNQMSADEAAKGYDRILKRFENTKGTQKEAMKADPEYAKQMNDTEQKITMEGLNAKKDAYKNHYDELMKNAENHLLQVRRLHENDIQAEKQAVDDEISNLDRAYSEGLIKAKEYHEGRTQYEKQSIDLSKKLREQERDNQIKIGDAQTQAADIKLRQLEKELKTGKDVQGQIIAAVRNRLAIEMQMVEMKAQKEIAAAGNSQSAITAIEMAAYNEKMGLIDKEQNYIQSLLEGLKSETADVGEGYGAFQHVKSFGTGPEGNAQVFSGYANEGEISKSSPGSAGWGFDVLSRGAYGFTDAMSALVAESNKLSNTFERLTATITSPLSQIPSPMAAAGISPTGFEGSTDLEAARAAIVKQVTQQQQNQVNNNYMIGDKGFTPTADVASKWAGLGYAIQQMQDNGFLGSHPGLSF